jgi:hypothetical protein
MTCRIPRTTPPKFCAVPTTAKIIAKILVQYKFHPIEDMIKTAKKLEGMDRINAADKIARYFYPTRKAIEVEGVLDTDVRIILGGTGD